MADADALVNVRHAGRRPCHEAFMNEDILGDISTFLDHRDLGAFRLSCKLARKATYSASSRLVLDTRRRPFLNWGDSDWYKRFLPSFSALRCLTLIDRGNNGQCYRAILRACLEAAKRAGADSPFDAFHAASPGATLALSLELAPRSLRSFTLEKPTRLGRHAELSEELLRPLATKFTALERLRIRHYNLPAHAVTAAVSSDEGTGTAPAPAGAGPQCATAAAAGVHRADGAVSGDPDQQTSAQPQVQAQQQPHRQSQQQQQQQQQQQEQQQAGQVLERPAVAPLSPSSLPRTLRKLVLHCWPSRDFTTSEAWAVELAQLTNLRELDLGSGAGGFFCPASREVGMTVPWTPVVAEAWQTGLTRLRRLSVRLALCLAPQGDVVPLQTHGLPLPVNAGTTDLAVFFDDFTIAGWASSETFEEQGITHEAYVCVALGVLVASLEACGDGRLASLEVQLPKPQDWGDVFRESHQDNHHNHNQIHNHHIHNQMLLPPPVVNQQPQAAQLQQQPPQIREPRAEINALLRRLVAHYRHGSGHIACGDPRRGAHHHHHHSLSGGLCTCGGGLEGLRSLALSVDTAGVLAPALRALLPDISPACGVTLTVGNWASHTDFLRALRLLGGRRVHIRVAKDKQLIYKWAMQAMEGSGSVGGAGGGNGEGAGGGDGGGGEEEEEDEGGRSIKDVMEAIQDEINAALGQLGPLSVSMDSFLGLPNVAATCAWPGHVEWLEGLGGVSKLRALHLTFSYGPAGSRRWHEVADVDSTLALVAESLRQLKVLSIHVTEELEQAGSGPDDSTAQSQQDSPRDRRAVADWRAARAAARAGHDLDRWRPRGAFNPVPHLQCLAAMPSLERLDLELDLASLYGVSGMVEDELRQLLETRWRGAEGDGDDDGDAPWGRRPLRVWCPQLSREAARRLSRLAAELLREAEDGVTGVKQSSTSAAVCAAAAPAAAGAGGPAAGGARQLPRGPQQPAVTAARMACDSDGDGWEDAFGPSAGCSCWSDSEDEEEDEEEAAAENEPAEQPQEKRLEAAVEGQQQQQQGLDLTRWLAHRHDNHHHTSSVVSNRSGGSGYGNGTGNGYPPAAAAAAASNGGSTGLDDCRGPSQLASGPSSFSGANTSGAVNGPQAACTAPPGEPNHPNHPSNDPGGGSQGSVEDLNPTGHPRSPAAASLGASGNCLGGAACTQGSPLYGYNGYNHLAAAGCSVGSLGGASSVSLAGGLEGAPCGYLRLYSLAGPGQHPGQYHQASTGFVCQSNGFPCQSIGFPCQGSGFPCQSNGFLCQSNGHPCQGSSFPCQSNGFPCQSNGHLNGSLPCHHHHLPHSSSFSNLLAVEAQQQPRAQPQLHSAHHAGQPSQQNGSDSTSHHGIWLQALHHHDTYPPVHSACVPRCCSADDLRRLGITTQQQGLAFPGAIAAFSAGAATGPAPEPGSAVFLVPTGAPPRAAAHLGMAALGLVPVAAGASAATVELVPVAPAAAQSRVAGAMPGAPAAASPMPAAGAASMVPASATAAATGVPGALGPSASAEPARGASASPSPSSGEPGRPAKAAPGRPRRSAGPSAAWLVDCTSKVC